VTITKFGVTIRYSPKDGISPLFATKKVAWRVCFEELFWFISGCTDDAEVVALAISYGFDTGIGRR
jgi:thymidylate synthase